MAATFNCLAAAEQARNAFTVIVLGASPSQRRRTWLRWHPAPPPGAAIAALVTVSFGIPTVRDRIRPIGLAANALIKADCSFNWRDQDGGLKLA